jgi:hypothetical protein
MTQRNPIARPRATNTARLAELHRLCDEDYAKGQQQRTIPRLSTSYTPAAICPMAEPSDLEVAVDVAKQLLDSDSVLSLREALRLLLRALDAEPKTEKGSSLVRTPGGDQRCPAAPSEDPTTVAALPPAVSDLLAAVVEALTVPLPSTDQADERAYHRLLEQRTTDVRIILGSILDFPDVPIDNDVADLRARIAETPVTYALYEPEVGE